MYSREEVFETSSLGSQTELACYQSFVCYKYTLHVLKGTPYKGHIKLLRKV